MNTWKTKKKRETRKEKRKEGRKEREGGREREARKGTSIERKNLLGM